MNQKVGEASVSWKFLVFCCCCNVGGVGETPRGETPVSWEKNSILYKSEIWLQHTEIEIIRSIIIQTSLNSAFLFFYDLFHAACDIPRKSGCETDKVPATIYYICNVCDKYRLKVPKTLYFDPFVFHTDYICPKICPWYTRNHSLENVRGTYEVPMTITKNVWSRAIWNVKGGRKTLRV